MKILIIGAKGNLGAQLVKVFSDGYDVIAWDREELDVTDENLVIKQIIDVKPDIIINAVAYNAVDKCETDKQEFELAKKLNGGAVGYLAEAAINIGAILIHYSTDYVFSGENKDGYKESDMPSPISKYGMTKLMGEQEIINRSDKNLKYYIIRTSKLFGPKGKSEFAKPSFFDIMLKLSRERDVLEVVDEEVSCFTYTVDLARATKKIIENNREFGIYHITNSGPCTWYESVIELFKMVVNRNIEVKPVAGDKFPRPAKRPKYSALLNTKFEQLRDWRLALAEYINNNS